MSEQDSLGVDAERTAARKRLLELRDKLLSGDESAMTLIDAELDRLAQRAGILDAAPKRPADQ